jgi:hypothetical protein
VSGTGALPSGSIDSRGEAFEHVMARLIRKATGGDANKLGSLFSEIDSRNFARQLLVNLDRIDASINKVRENSKGMIDRNVKDVLMDAEASLTRIRVTTRYFADHSGNYIGAFDGAVLPEGAIEVPEAPEDAQQIWNGEAWGALPLQVPDRVSPAQAEIALYRYDVGVLLGRVNDLIAAYPYEPVRIWWRKATYISRDHPYLQALALELELSDELVDTLFVEANAI